MKMWPDRSLKHNLMLASSAATVKEEAVSSSFLHPFKRTTILLRSLARPEQRMVRAACHQQAQAITSHNSDNHHRRVVFREQVTIHHTISREDTLPEEQAATWFSAQEFQTISQSCFLQIQMLNRGKRLKGKKYCARGLESETKVGLRTKSMNRLLAKKVVLEEQDRQRREGVREPHYLAYLYFSATASCQVWANVVGLSDQRAAEDEMDTIFTGNCRDSSPSSWHLERSRTSVGSSLLSRNIALARSA